MAEDSDNEHPVTSTAPLREWARHVQDPVHDFGVYPAGYVRTELSLIRVTVTISARLCSFIDT